ncbi:TetR/AcrR family transcriptional regulator [Flavobacterium sp.]|uniref:TetR/AcrR family transcriptional regulator n=1 Tax=Flavobacterium sp. TaxID=239 RepID=UPI00121B0504|nr:TetR/AcrR family transcriptional regulator [Flavobacterium sp.]RZJ70306.1 MAG: TetR/AcrR family transcriptional regulator [Flavobacterium sp.]
MENQLPKNTAKSKELSKQKFLDAVDKLFKEKGFSALKVNDIAQEAGLDKKLIYRYFGGKDELVDEYIKSLDFWSNVKKEAHTPDFTDGGREFSKRMLSLQFDYLNENESFKKLLLWGLSEVREPLTKIADEREINGEMLLSNITDPFFGKDAQTYRATIALLISGGYYLSLYAGVNGNTFCGIDITTDEGKSQIKDAMSKVVDFLYDSNRSENK